MTETMRRGITEASTFALAARIEAPVTVLSEEMSAWYLLAADELADRAERWIAADRAGGGYGPLTLEHISDLLELARRAFDLSQVADAVSA